VFPVWSALPPAKKSAVICVLMEKMIETHETQTLWNFICGLTPKGFFDDFHFEWNTLKLPLLAFVISFANITI